MTCVAYFVPPVLRQAGIAAVAWNFVLFILWIAVFGVFGSVCDHCVDSRSGADRRQMFIKEDPEGDSGIERMKSAVWVDLVNALLWLTATLAAAGYWWTHRDTRSRFTGRAHV